MILADGSCLPLKDTNQRTENRPGPGGYLFDLYAFRMKLRGVLLAELCSYFILKHLYDAVHLLFDLL